MTPEERAHSARDILFKRYDELNALWLQAEEQLTQFHIPRPVYYKYDEYQDPNGQQGATTSKYLSLQKIKGKWRICHSLYEDWCDHEHGLTPITECSAQVRIEAVEHFDKFRTKVVKSTEDFIPEVDEAIKKLDSSIRLHGNVESRDQVAKRAKLNGHHTNSPFAIEEFPKLNFCENL